MLAAVLIRLYMAHAKADVEQPTVWLHMHMQWVAADLNLQSISTHTSASHDDRNTGQFQWQNADVPIWCSGQHHTTPSDAEARVAKFFLTLSQACGKC